MLSVHNLSKSYRHATDLAVSDLSFQLSAGEIVGLLGPNGAGKTTIMRMLAGSMSASAGSIDRAPGTTTGYLPERLPLDDDLRVEETLRFVATIKGVDLSKPGAVEEVLQRTSLSERRQQLVGRLSKGYRQRLGLAQALLGTPALLLLDEPTAGLDPLQVRSMRDLLQSLAGTHTVLLSSHILHEVARVCSRVLLVNHGRLVADARVEDLTARHGSLESAFVNLTSHPLETTGENDR